MEKETKRNIYVLHGDEEAGTVQISDEVVAVIAGIAATEVEGVSSMNGNITNELMSKVGIKSLSRGVRVELLNQTVKVSMAVVLDYGYNIPTTCRKVQEKVKSNIENMTGLSVTDVNIRIAGIDMNKNK